MTVEREMQIRKMGLSGGIHGIAACEIRYLEQKYGIKCTKYGCGGCVMSFLKRLEAICPLEKFIEENEKE